MGKKRRAKEAKLQQQLTLDRYMTVSGRAEDFPPAQTHSATSMAAANEIKEVAPILREQVYTAIFGSDCGLTDEEICAETGLDGNTERPRRVSLVAAGRIEANGKRKTSSGRQATVWIPT